MGILKSGILGPVYNKTGNTVSRMHKNVNVVTVKYKINNKPATSAQLEVQEKLGMLSSFLSKIDELIALGFKHYAKGKDPLNVAYAYNYADAFLKDEAGLKLNYPKIIYSRGYIVPPESPTVLALPGQIEFNWLPQRQSKYCLHTDLATVLVYNPKKEEFITLVGVTDRYAQGYLLDIPTTYSGNTVHCYMSFTSKEDQLQGNSMYLGELVCV